jgi:LysR family transcriptional regulator, benzoate and cis,cis-muconate-responsive activator of ben and cat genes
MPDIGSGGKDLVAWLTMPNGYAHGMELRHLRYFVAVAEEQNVTRAAVRLHVSQPPLSRQIRDLEHDLGIALFDHGARSVRLTEAGRVFLKEAQAVLRRVEEAVQTVRAVADGQRGEIDVGYAPSLTVEILPRALRQFQESSPGVRVRLHDLSTQGMLRGLRDGNLHVALMIQTSTRVLDGLVFEEVSRFAVCMAAHPSHPLARSRKVGLENIIEERLIAYTLVDYPEYHAWLATLFGKMKRAPRIAEEHDSSTSLIASVEAGRGIALVQQGFECLAGPRLKVRRLAPAPPPFVVGMAYCKKGLPKVAADFITAVKQATGAHPH